MAEIVTAIYENGVLRPLKPLRLRENQIVQVSVVFDDEEDDREALIRVLVEEGLVEPPEVDDGPDPVSAEERQYLADLLGRAPGKPLSELVIEDRGEW
jgi:predicted DNA-binding antitoxin AbrB/MazE fold protein